MLYLQEKKKMFPKPLTRLFTLREHWDVLNADAAGECVVTVSVRWIGSGAELLEPTC